MKFEEMYGVYVCGLFVGGTGEILLNTKWPYGLGFISAFCFGTIVWLIIRFTYGEKE